jgi:HSP20 family protein
MKFDALKENLGNVIDNLAEGWRHLPRSAAGALTRFRPGGHSGMPAREEVDDDFYLPGRGWSMLGGDVFEDDDRLVVRLELPGMDKQDINIEVLDDALVVSGEKRFQRESSEGRWRVMQCAYGSFRRSVPLPEKVRPEAARASYVNGVLRVELPKAYPGRPGGVTIRID